LDSKLKLRRIPLLLAAAGTLALSAAVMSADHAESPGTDVSVVSHLYVRTFMYLDVRSLWNWK